MTRKDFELIARVLKDTPRYAEWRGIVKDDRAELAEAFAAELAAGNPLFDRARFLAACGVETQEA